MLKINGFTMRFCFKDNFIKKCFLSIIIIFIFINSAGLVFGASSPLNEKEVKEKLSQILSEFDPDYAGENNLFNEKLREFIRELLKKINPSQVLDQNLNEKSIPEGTFRVLSIIAIAVIVLILVLLLYLIFRNFTISRKVMMDEDAQILSTIKDPDVIINKAEQCIQNGDYNQALRFLYISMLLRFNELNIIRINKSKTNKQYLLEIQDSKPKVHSIVAGFTRDFNRYWYGKKELDKLEFDSLYKTYTAIVEREGQGIDG